MRLDETFTDQVDALVREAVQQQQAPGVVAGVARGDDVHVATAGSLAIDGPPVQRDSLFRIASMTKPITAAAILVLADEGRLTLEEPVDRLLPELADRRVLRDPRGPIDDTVPAARPITVRDLLTFTWGFGQQGALFDGERWPIVRCADERRLATFGPPEPATPSDPDTWIARLAELPLMSQPGERWLYHTGSQVLGVLAARAAGRPFAEVLRSRVLDPLGMDDTRFHTTATDRLATSYMRRDGELSVYDPPDGQWAAPPTFEDGGGGLVSTVDDMLAFGRALLRGGAPILATDAVAEMTRDQLTAEQRSRVWPGFDILTEGSWGYGVSVLDDGSYGWAGGLGTTWTNVPAHDTTVVVLTQRAADETGFPAVCFAITDLVRDRAETNG